MKSTTTVDLGNLGTGQELHGFFQFGDGVLIVAGAVKFLGLIDQRSNGQIGDWSSATVWRVA
jgi:hypothetical protein